MSAAEPVRPGPPTNGPATVLAFRRPRHPSRETRMPATPDPDLTPEQKLAATIERAFAEHARSLTDPDTALDFTITVNVFATVLEGARAQGKLGEDEFTLLHGMVQGMRDAPQLLA